MKIHKSELLNQTARYFTAACPLAMKLDLMSCGKWLNTTSRVTRPMGLLLALKRLDSEIWDSGVAVVRT